MAGVLQRWCLNPGSPSSATIHGLLQGQGSFGCPPITAPHPDTQAERAAACSAMQASARIKCLHEAHATGTHGIQRSEST